MPAATSAHVLGPDQGRAVELAGFGARFMVGAERSGGGFSLVEHAIGPRTLAAPLHTHRNEDEYSYVLEGEVGFQLAEEIHYALPGELVFKPRGVPHAFWNRTDRRARVLEIISPGGFEEYFAEIAPLLPPNRAEPDLEALGAVMARYGLEMDFASIDLITVREGLRPPRG